MISALKGRRPRPLDERGVHVTGSDCTSLLVLCQAKIVAVPVFIRQEVCYNMANYASQ